MRYLISVDTDVIPIEHRQHIDRYIEYMLSFDDFARNLSDGIEREMPMMGQLKAKELLAILVENRSGVVKVADILPHD